MDLSILNLGFGVFAGAMILIGVLVIAAAIAVYALECIGFRNVARARAYGKPNMLFVPFYRWYVMSEIIGDSSQQFGYTLRPLSLIMLLAVLARFFLADVSLLGEIVTLAAAAAFYFFYCKFFERMWPGQNTVFAGLIAGTMALSILPVIGGALSLVSTIVSLVMILLTGSKELRGY